MLDYHTHRTLTHHIHTKCSHAIHAYTKHSCHTTFLTNHTHYMDMTYTCMHTHQECTHITHSSIPFKLTDKNLFIYAKPLATHTTLTPYPPQIHIEMKLHVLANAYTECKHNAYATLLHTSYSPIPYRQAQRQNLGGFGKRHYMPLSV